MVSNDGGPAFPLEVKNDDGTYFAIEAGMSLRDWFAGQALKGLCSTPSMRGIWDATDMARQSYHYADAMLAERSKP